LKYKEICSQNLPKNDAAPGFRRAACSRRRNPPAKFQCANLSINKTQIGLFGKKMSIFQKAARDGERSVA
jgi:hypothetical protein